MGVSAPCDLPPRSHKKRCKYRSRKPRYQIGFFAVIWRGQCLIGWITSISLERGKPFASTRDSMNMQRQLSLSAVSEAPSELMNTFSFKGHLQKSNVQAYLHSMPVPIWAFFSTTSWRRLTENGSLSQSLLPIQVDKRPSLPNQQQSPRLPGKDPKQREDFYANIGEAIRTLKAEIPRLFQEDLTCESPRALAYLDTRAAASRHSSAPSHNPWHAMLDVLLLLSML